MGIKLARGRAAASWWSTTSAMNGASPMTSIASVAQALQTVLTTDATQAARLSGCIQRQGKFTGASLCQTLVFGWLANPQATLSQLCQMAAACGVTVSPQGLDQRFTPELAACLELVLDSAVRQVVQASPRTTSLLARFPEVVVRDSSTLTLPAVLGSIWQGCGDATAEGHQAVLKLGAGLHLRSGTLDGPVLAAGREHDRTVAALHPPLLPGTLLLQDLGYFSVATFAALQAAGIHVLSRLQHGTAVFAPDGTRLDLARLLPQIAARVDRPVLVGASQRLPMRLLAIRVPEEVANQRRRRMHEEAHRRGQEVKQDRLILAAWTILVTTVPSEQLALDEAIVLVRARWQIELLFKLWKSGGRVDAWRTRQPDRILCEVYAKLIGLVIQHWLTLLGPWRELACSLPKAAAAVRAGAQHLAFACRSLFRCAAAIREIVICAAAGSRLNPRKRHPSAYQCWLDPALGSYA